MFYQVKAPRKRGSFNEDQTCRLTCLTICVCVTVLTFASKYIYYNALSPEVTLSVFNKATCEDTLTKFGFQFAQFKKIQNKSTVTEHFCCYSRRQQVQVCGYDTHLAMYFEQFV